MLSELRLHYQKLRDRQVGIEAEFSSFSDQELASRPKGNSWSLLEIAHHLILVEQATLAKVTKNLDSLGQAKEAGLVSRFSLGLLTFVFNGRLRFKVPIAAVVPSGDFSRMELESGWEKLQERWPEVLSAFSEETCRKLVFRHPVFGWYNIEQTLDFLITHTDHHLGQIERTKTALGLDMRQGS